VLPNNDGLFASLAILAIGHDREMAAMLAMLGLLLMATHLTLGIALTASELFRRNAAA
jgi:hypothetical protein